LATTREVTLAGLAAKTTLEMHDFRRKELGLEPAIHELLYVRERWATVTNQALKEAHIEARVDHRSLAAQGIDREPYPHIPRAAFEMERHGFQSFVGERMRAEYEARVQAREESRAREPLQTPALGRHDVPGHQSAAREPLPSEAVTREPAREPPNQSRSQPVNLEEIRRQAREEWLKSRNVSAGTSAATSGKSAGHGKSKDDSYSL
jgi:hypothetical protein